jgi:hypothetical protein
MKATKRVESASHPARLHAALDAAGVPVLTIRSDWASDRDEVAIHSVIVFADGYDPAAPAEAAKIQTIIDAHLATVVGKKPSKLKRLGVDGKIEEYEWTPEEKEASLRKMEEV